MVKTMADRPVILALANPEPEIRPEVAKAARPDCIIATGRSDYPNQVNNVLCFPYIFRGALDCGATRITDEMKLACVSAIAELAEAEPNDAVAAAYAGEDLSFGPDYIIPKPFDPRLMAAIAPAVAKAAEESGVAARPITDMAAYRERLAEMIYHTGFFMKPVFAQAKANPRRVAYAEADDARVLRAVQTVVDSALAQPVLIGRAAEIAAAIRQNGLRLREGVDYTIVEAEGDTTLQGTQMLASGAVDALICGMRGSYDSHLNHVRNVIGMAPGAGVLAAMNALVLDKLTLFITDTYVNDSPSSRGTGGDHAPGGGRAAPVRPRTESRPALALDLRLVRTPVGTQDARSARAAGGVRPGTGRDRRSAWRRGPVGRHPPPVPARGRLCRQRQPAGDAFARRRQHHLQYPEGLVGQGRDGRPDPARRGESGAHPEPQRDGAQDRQHDGAGGGGRALDGPPGRRQAVEFSFCLRP